MPPQCVGSGAEGIVDPTWPSDQQPGLYSPNGKMYYHHISCGFEAARLGVEIIVSLWNFTKALGEFR